MPEHIRLQFYADADTHIGKVRQSNQDSAFAWTLNPSNREALALLLVADGLGGHKQGGMASQIVVNTVSQNLVSFLEKLTTPQPLDTLKTKLLEAIQHANTAVYDYAQHNLKHTESMGTTLVCALLQGAQAIIANIGDSRAYLLNRTDLQQLTSDHTLLTELIQDGFLNSKELEDFADRNLLTRALGTGRSVQVDLSVVSLAPGDRLLLCSDGMWSALPQIDEMKKLLTDATTPTTAVSQLIESANAHGGPDNIGVAVCYANPAQT